MAKNSLIIILFPLFTLLFSCNEGIVFHEQKEIVSGIWNIEDVYSFTANIQNNELFYDIYLTFEIDKDFLTSNLWVFIQTESPLKNVLTDTVMYFITDETGKWYGKEQRETVEYKLLYKSMIKFPEKGDYIFNLKNGMRENNLPKIHSAGLLIKKTKLPEGNQYSDK